MNAVLPMAYCYPPAPGPVPVAEQGSVHLLPVPLHDAPPRSAASGRQGEQVMPRAKSGKFKPRAMYKDDLAAWYGISRKTFVNHYLPPVMKRLLGKGYTPTCKLLSLAMVNIIVQHHDWPGD